MELVEYLDARGRSPFRRWFDRLDPAAAAKVTVVLTRLSQDNVSSLKSVGGGVLEARIDWGPGYRVYLCREGAVLVVLLGGGTKQRQAEDIAAARARRADYEARRR